MTLPTVVSVGAVAAGTADVVPGLPAGWAENDIFLLGEEQSAVNAFISPPTGWALVPDSQQEAGSLATDGCLQVFWKRATSSESDPTVTDAINHTQARIIAIRGCITTGDPWDVTSGGIDTAADTALVVTGDTTTVADCLVVVFFATSPDIASTTEVSDWANADLANVTERMDNWHDNGNGGGFGCATGEKATAGAYGNTTATLVTTANKAFCTIALKPPAVGGGTNNNLLEGKFGMKLAGKL